MMDDEELQGWSYKVREYVSTEDMHSLFMCHLF